jgi:predicted DNA-binding transcriptional regulator AlpA
LRKKEAGSEWRASTEVAGRNLREALLQPVAYTLPDAAAISGSSRSKFYELVTRGDIPSRMNGRIPVILHEDLIAWLRSLPLRGEETIAPRYKALRKPRSKPRTASPHTAA